MCTPLAPRKDLDLEAQRRAVADETELRRDEIWKKDRMASTLDQCSRGEREAALVMLLSEGRQFQAATDRKLGPKNRSLPLTSRKVWDTLRADIYILMNKSPLRKPKLKVSSTGQEHPDNMFFTQCELAAVHMWS